MLLWLFMSVFLVLFYSILTYFTKLIPYTSNLGSNIEKRALHILVWQSRPSCSNYMSTLEKLRSDIALLIGMLRYFLGDSCYGRKFEKCLVRILEKGRSRRAVNPFKMEIGL